MATYTKFNQFVEDTHHKVHNLNADALTVALTNTAPVATNTVLANIVEVAYTNLSSRLLVVASAAQTSGTYKIVINDLTLTAGATSIGPFKYVVVYNDTPTSPVDPLISWYEYPGAAITLLTGETLLLDFDPTNGFLQDV